MYWKTHYVDGTVVRAHARDVAQHAAGAVGGQDAEALGRSRGGFSAEVHLRAEGGGKPLTFVVSGGERHELRYLAALLARRQACGGLRRPAEACGLPCGSPGRGHSRGRPECLVGDRGYNYPSIRRLLARRGVRAVIPRRRDQRPSDGRHALFDHVAYRERNRVERLMNRLKQHRRIATRYEKRAAHYVAMLTLAAAVLWLEVPRVAAREKPCHGARCRTCRLYKYPAGAPEAPPTTDHAL